MTAIMAGCKTYICFIRFVLFHLEWYWVELIIFCFEILFESSMIRPTTRKYRDE